MPADYDGDGTTDLAIFRPSNGRWYVDGIAGYTTYGRAGDIPVPGQYDADPAIDFAVFRPSNGRWYVDGASGFVTLGVSGDIPVPGQYDADARRTSRCSTLPTAAGPSTGHIRPRSSAPRATSRLRSRPPSTW